MKKSLIAAALAALIAAPAVAADLPQSVKDAGKVVIANTPNYPPMEFKDPKTNELQGLDIDISRALAKTMGVDAEFAEIGFEQMPASLDTGRVDVIHSGMSDLPKRHETMVFLDYLTSGAQVFTLSKNGEKIKSLADICGLRVAMSRRTSFPDETAKWSAEHCEAQGKPAVIVVGSEGSADARLQLKQGRADAAMQGAETVPYLQKNEPDTYLAIGEPITTVYQGIAFKKGNDALLEAYKAAFGKLMASGEYKQILDKWDLGSRAMDGIRVNGELVK